MSDHAALIPAAASAHAQAKGRIGVAFGRRFFILLLVGLVWIAPAFVQPRFLYAMLVWDVLLLLFWAIDLVRMPAPRQLTVMRSWSAPLALSVDTDVQLSIVNSSRSFVRAWVTDDIPVQFRSEVPEVELAVAPRGELSGSYRITPKARGDAEVGQAYVRYESAFRLAERWAVTPLQQTVRVYPNLDEAKRHSIYLMRSRQIEMEKRYARIRGAGREFESLREYREGDEYRDICWSASARRGKLVTRQYQIERSQTIWLMVDSGRLMRTRVANLMKLDYAANAALSLAQVALYSGDRVGIFTYGRNVRNRLAPARGSSHVRQIIEVLSKTESEGSEADHLQAAAALMAVQKRRSLVVWLTELAETAMTPEVIEAASLLMPQHLVLFVVIGQPDMAQVAAADPATVPEMYLTTAAQEVLHRRELLLARLRDRGALALEATSGTLSTTLVNSYLSIKQRNQL